MNIYAIYDKKAKVYHTPFFMRQDEEAVRALREAIAAGDSPCLSFYPEDYKLYRIGEWDEETAEIFYKHSSMMEIDEIQIDE